MSDPKQESTGSSAGARRRATRSSRGRKETDDASNGTELKDPRIAGRRPARSTAKQPDADAKSPSKPVKASASEVPKKRAPRRRSASTKKTKSTDSTAVSESKSASTRRRSSVGAATSDLDVDGLVTEVRALRVAIEEQSKSFALLRERQEQTSRRLRLGVFVDVPNLIYGAERGEEVEDGSIVHMGKLLSYLSDGRELIRATAYSPVSDDPAEPVEHQRFVMPFVRHDYRIVTKPMKRFADGSVKGNFDVEMALDMVTMADRLDVASIVSGDADFARAVELLQGKGVRVEVVAFSGSTSVEMRALADHYIDVGTIMDRVGV